MEIKNKFERQYRLLLKDVIKNGVAKQNRTGVFAFTKFNQSIEIDLQDGFPIITGKKIFFEKALAEYNWIVQGLTTLTYLHEHDVMWWDEYANVKGELGKTYGYQLRNFNGEIDQLNYVHNQIRSKTRRAHITFWNPSELDEIKLPPCFTSCTFMAINGSLNLSVNMRSSDLFLGLPYDIIVFALFLNDVAKFNDLIPRKLGFTLVDAHVYKNHVKQIQIYCSKQIRTLPTLYTHPETNVKSLFQYKHGPYINAPLNN